MNSEENVLNIYCQKVFLQVLKKVSDWAVPSLVFCHYAPYDFMLRKPGEAKTGNPGTAFIILFIMTA